MLVEQNFGVGRRYDVAMLQSALPSTRRLDFSLALVPTNVGQLAVVAALPVYLLVGLVLQRLVRPKNLRDSVAISLVAGMCMAVVAFAGAGGTLVPGDDVLDRQGEQLQLLAESSLLGGEAREQAVAKLLDRWPDLIDQPPERRAELLAKGSTVITAVTMARMMWAGLVISFVICLPSCLVGCMHDFRLRAVDPRLWKTVLVYLEVMLLTAVLSGIAVVQVAAWFRFESDNGHTLPLYSAGRFLALSICLLAMIPGLRLWRWYWRLPAYAVLWGVSRALATLT